MTIEQGAQAPDQPTPDTPQAPPDRLSVAAAALAKMRGGGGEEPAPEPAAEPEAPAETKAEPGPSIDDLEGLLQKRAAAREAEERAEAERKELEELRKAKASWEQSQSQPKTVSPEDFAKLPLDQRKAILQQLTKSVLSPDVLSVEQEVAKLRDELGKGRTDDEMSKRLERLESELQAEKRAKVESEYLSVAVDKDKRPLLSRLDPKEAVAWGDHIFNTYSDPFQAEYGRALTFADAADIIERELQARVNRLTGGDPQVGAPTQASDAAKRGTDGPQGGPTTLSNDLVADAPSSRPQTHEDKLALAERKLKRMRGGGG